MWVWDIYFLYCYPAGVGNLNYSTHKFSGHYAGERIESVIRINIVGESFLLLWRCTEDWVRRWRCPPRTSFLMVLKFKWGLLGVKHYTEVFFNSFMAGYCLHLDCCLHISYVHNTRIFAVCLVSPYIQTVIASLGLTVDMYIQ